MSEAPGRRLRPDLPYRRIALLLTGGGALGAYEVGVLRVLERLALAPHLVAGVSIGAINAVVWLAHGRRTAALEAAWRRLRGPAIGLQWVTLALRVAGLFLLAVALLESFLTLVGSRELSGAFWIWKKSSARLDLLSTQLDIVLWLIIALLGLAVLVFARPIERWLSQAGGASAGGPDSGRRLLGRLALGAALLHATVWLMAWPWPHRFSASAVALLSLAWLASGPGRGGQFLRGLAFGLMPETKGRGLWSGRRRRRVIEELVGSGTPQSLVAPGTRLVMSALAVDSGRVCHFVTWPDWTPAFEARVRESLGELVVLRTPEDAVSAAVASSAIPGVFEPECIDQRHFVDAGGLSNQPLHLALADDADAVIVVLLNPSESPAAGDAPRDLVGLGGRLMELANWRDLQAELRELPPGWSRTGDPARVCVIEPSRPLPGTLLDFVPAQAERLIALGEADAWRALARVGWLTPGVDELRGAPVE